MANGLEAKNDGGFVAWVGQALHERLYAAFGMASAATSRQMRIQLWDHPAPKSATGLPSLLPLQKSTDPVREGIRFRSRAAPDMNVCGRASYHPEVGSGANLRRLSCRFRELGTCLRRCGVRTAPVRWRTRPTPALATVPSRRQRVDLRIKSSTAFIKTFLSAPAQPSPSSRNVRPSLSRAVFCSSHRRAFAMRKFKLLALGGRPIKLEGAQTKGSSSKRTILDGCAMRRQIPASITELRRS